MTAAHAKADKIFEKLDICFWSFGLAAVWLIANGLYTFLEAHQWSRFIAVSNGKMPWTATPNEFDQVLYDNFKVPPSKSEFSLYEAMLITAAAMLVMGITIARNAFLTKHTMKQKKEKRARRAFARSAMLCGVFLLAFLANEHSCNKVLAIADYLQSNKEVATPPHHH